jgi:uncharacterized protein (TIGR03066 family)
MLLHGIMVLALVAGFAAEDNAAKIVGVWTGTQKRGDQTGELTWDFAKGGKCKATLKVGEVERSRDGTYKVEADKLTVTFELNGNRIEDPYTIKELTKDKLVLVSDKTKDATSFSRK